jgi:hypothetical protein
VPTNLIKLRRDVVSGLTLRLADLCDLCSVCSYCRDLAVFHERSFQSGIYASRQQEDLYRPAITAYLPPRLGKTIQDYTDLVGPTRTGCYVSRDEVVVEGRRPACCILVRPWARVLYWHCASSVFPPKSVRRAISPCFTDSASSLMSAGWTASCRTRLRSLAAANPWCAISAMGVPPELAGSTYW